MSAPIHPPPRLKTRLQTQGYSLVEVLLALALTGLAAVAILTLYRSHQDAYTLNSRLMEEQSRLRAAMAVIAHHVRSAGYDPTERAGAGIVSARADYLYITRDLAGEGSGSSATRPDGRLTAAGEHIAFCLYGANTLGMHSGRSGGGSCSGSGGAALDRPGMGFHQPLADHLTELRLRYFVRDADGELVERLPDPVSGEVAAPHEIRRIDIILSSVFHHRGREYRRTLNESLYLRNMEP
ncbi:prepilin-type N-terminal cleavage/methylation domain-containing protein [Geoalkalibacter halelectricus]|uniref:prepilin-type N-terminal cleavage/methylation domain-containing protein n=1 Tax=Geoalkalibacter halelectricus TaxID=2847045 RepID=UPI003D19A427